MPIYALSFSNRVFADSKQGGSSILMGVGSYLPQYNKLQILRMNGERGLTKEVEINEPWPQSKILWYPRPDESFGPGNDLIATSSDILRLYEIHESDGIYRQSREPIPFVN